jgi:ubiquitin C-terminal hydrolase
VAVPDFLEYLSDSATEIFNPIRSNVFTSLQCQRCKWVSISMTSEVLIKLYLPDSRQSISLAEVLAFNSVTKISEAFGVHCAKCGIKTAHSSQREHHSDILIFEIIRVTKAKRNWAKHSIPISFPVNGLMLPSSDRKYNVIGTCNHTGSIRSGHWFTKLRMRDDRWFALDDLQSSHSVVDPPGLNDTSTVLLVLLANDSYA